VPFYPLEPQLHYLLPEFGIRMPFKPVDFTQVNHHINRVLVAKALRLLEVQPQDRVADLFCGLGNFTCRWPRRHAKWWASKADALTERALDNAKANGLSDKTTFYTATCSSDGRSPDRAGQVRPHADRPAARWRAMVSEALVALRQSRADLLPSVSSMCRAARRRWRAMRASGQRRLHAEQAGVVNMFPHTSHVESMAVFDLPAA
jgi:23S rRNA (uracil1939-C5)-methyltransferase